MDYSKTIVIYDIKCCRCSQLKEYMSLYEYQRSTSFIDLFGRSLRSNIFSSGEPKAHWLAYRKGRPPSSIVRRRPSSTLFYKNTFSSETTGPIKVLYGASMGWANKNLFTWSWSHDNNWPPCLYMLKTLKHLLLRYQKADELETLYASSGAHFFHFCSNNDPGLTLFSFVVLFRKTKFLSSITHSHIMIKMIECLK